MDITKDTQPMANFLNHSAQIMQHLKDTKRPVVLTVNGKAAAVVQDPEAYQHLLDLAAEASAAEGIRQGLEDARNGCTRPAREAFDELRADRVEVAARAFRDLRPIYVTIQAADQQQARDWFDGLENAVFSLAEYPARGAVIPEAGNEPNTITSLTARPASPNRDAGYASCSIG